MIRVAVRRGARVTPFQVRHSPVRNCAPEGALLRELRCAIAHLRIDTPCDSVQVEQQHRGYGFRVRQAHPGMTKINAMGIKDTTPPSRDTLRPSFANSSAQKMRAQGSRVRAAPAVSCAKGSKNTRSRAYRFTGSSPAFPAQWFYGLLRALVSGGCARMCGRAVLTNRPSLDLSPFVLEGQEPAGERGTGPVSSSTRTVAWA